MLTVFQAITNLSILTFISALPDIIHIGGLFDSEDEDLELAFRYAIDRINADDSILPRSRLAARVHKLRPNDSFHAAKVVCHLLEEGVAAIFGPTSPASNSLVNSTCETLKVPHVNTHWNYRPFPNSMGINVHPDTDALGKAFLGIVNMTKWKSFTILYEDSEDLIRLQDVLKSPVLLKSNVSLKQFHKGDSYKKIMKDLYKARETNIILDIPINKVKEVLRQAEEVHMLTEYNNYLVTSLDLHTLSFDDFVEVRSNITGLRLVDPDRPEVNSTIRDWIFGELRYGRRIDGRHHIKTQTALMYDAMTLFARALHDLDGKQTLTIRPVSCVELHPWPHGKSLINYMKLININGLTGIVEFDERGRRVTTGLDVIDVKKEGIRKVGIWTEEKGVDISEEYLKIMEKQRDANIVGRTLKVTSLENAPYASVKADAANRTGNDKYEGYVVDLITELAKKVGFYVHFYIVPDGRYGGKTANGDWDGMIKELLTRDADIAIADLTITSERQEAVDFTRPFLDLGISILYKKEPEQATSLFSFLKPLSIEVWFYMATAYLGVSLLLFFLARFTPYEWVNPHPCDVEVDELENDFNLPNSLWCTIGALMQQGSDLAPRSVSIRLLLMFWWLFSLIMISTYTANLAAFLTASRMMSPIENANDLAKQTAIQYGCVTAASTYNFFKKARSQPFKRMFAYMDSTRPTVLVDNNQKGIDRVLKGNYAFIMESTTIEYQVAKYCDLIQIGGTLDKKGYGIATPKNSPHTITISRALTKLQEDGTMFKLKQKWWKGQSSCQVVGTSSATNELGLANVGGVFVALVGGVIMALIIVVLEFVWRTKKVPRDLRDTVCVELMKEMKLVLTSRGSTRPIPKSESASMNESLKLVPLKNTTAKP